MGSASGIAREAVFAQVESGIFIGCLASTSADALRENQISSVLSLLRSGEKIDGVEHMVVDIDDLESEDILTHLPRCMDFIYDHSKDGGRVLVHCQAGCSRSAAVIVAYLIATKKLSTDEALAMVRAAQPAAEPNAGFMKQLELWKRMGGRLDMNHPQYRLFRLQAMAQKKLDGSLTSTELVEGLDGGAGREWTYRCKICRKQLFTQNNIIGHEFGAGQGAFKWHKRADPIAQKNKQADTCTSFFLQPIRWMARDIVGANVYDGKLHCDKCNSRVGNFNWSGAQCSCGTWVSPAFEVHKKKVDAMFQR